MFFGFVFAVNGDDFYLFGIEQFVEQRVGSTEYVVLLNLLDIVEVGVIDSDIG